MQYNSFENTVENGEIARYKQFLLFPLCFLPVWRTFCHFHQIWNCHLQTLSVWKSLKFVILERVKHLSSADDVNLDKFEVSAVKYTRQSGILTHPHTMTPFDAPGKQAVWNTVGKGEIARNEQFLLFSTVFSTCLNNFLSLSSNLKLSSANFFCLEESKICCLVMG